MKSNQIVMLLAFISRGKSKKYIELLENHNIRLHLQTIGQGTAPSEMMDIFGLGESDKDVIVSFAPRKAAARLAEHLSDNMGYTARLGGIYMEISLSAVNRLTSVILNREDREFVSKGNEEMNNDTKQSLIFITVNPGYTDEVMQCARRVGAAGGTVMRARLAGSEKLELFDERDTQDEKEIISILASENVAGAIMNEINAHFGLKTDASGMVCSVPVDRAFKI